MQAVQHMHVQHTCMCVLILVKQLEVSPHDGMVCWPQRRREHNAAHIPAFALLLQTSARQSEVRSVIQSVIT